MEVKVIMNMNFVKKNNESPENPWESKTDEEYSLCVAGKGLLSWNGPGVALQPLTSLAS